MRFHPFAFTGKEKDEETGYDYFGARYMDHEVMTMWLSVDPMADKYPSISPYAYCAWNPVKLVDPDGREVWPTSKEAYQMILSSLPPDARNYVKLNANGFIDKELINSYSCESLNFKDLQELVNLDDCVIEVSVANSFKYIAPNGEEADEFFTYFNDADFIKGLSGATADFSRFEETDPYATSTGEEGILGVTSLPVPMSDPYTGHRSTNRNIRVFVCSQLSIKGRAELFSHEFYGHAYMYATTRDAKRASHDFPEMGMVDNNTELKNRIIRAQNESKSYHR